MQLAEEAARSFRMLTTRKLVIMSGVKMLLKKLRKEKRLAVICNGQRSFTMPEFEKFGINGFFDYILFSSDVKACKPNSKIFARALKELKACPRDTVYIGDNLINDVAGALNAGMRTIWIDHGCAGGKKNKIFADAEVTKNRYSAIPDIVDRLLG